MDKNKIEITKAMMKLECYPIIIERDIDVKKHIKLPLSKLSALGVAFEPLTAAVQNIFSGGEMATGIYRVTIPNGTHLAARIDSTGYIGSALSNSTNQIAGQATLNPLVCNPTLLFMAVALAHIDKRLENIQETQQEILDFLTQKERSELKGDLKFLADVVDNYKYNWNNDKYKNNNHIKVLDIQQSAESKIEFYQEQIVSSLKKKTIFHYDQDVDKQLSKIQVAFRDYQISLYLYSFASFLQVMLLENFSSVYLESVSKKIEDYSFEYRELYTKTFDQIEKYANSSIQSNLIKGWASVNKIAGEAISKVPIVKNSQIDEFLIGNGEKVEGISAKRTTQTMRQFIKNQSAYVSHFVENINTVNRLYNQSHELLFDKENIYLDV